MVRYLYGMILFELFHFLIKMVYGGALFSNTIVIEKQDYYRAVGNKVE